MKIPVFLSYPKPHLMTQIAFIEKVNSELASRDLVPLTLGVSKYDMDAPLVGIRKLMIEANGILTIAFKRTLINKGLVRAHSDLDITPSPIKNQWLTSPYCHIESAMAFQLGLPVMILRENGVIADGILEKGVLGMYMPEFDSSNFTSYFETKEWQQLIQQWIDRVKQFR